MIIDIKHPEYSSKTESWTKFGKAYAGGHDFVTDYVEKFSDRETSTEYDARLVYSYTPAFAKEAINEIKNAIFQRITDVVRDGGTESFQSATRGLNGGVDLQGSSMNAYSGRYLLPELLVKGKVGVYVDMPMIDGASRADAAGIRPYIYMFKAEDILSWKKEYTPYGYVFTNILLRETVDAYDEEYMLPDDTLERYRHLYIDDPYSENPVVNVDFYDADGKQIDIEGNESTTGYTLEIPMIPFAVGELSDSLMTDVADYQIALVNLASSDISYSLRSNFPFYTEQVDFRMQSNYLRTNDGYSDNTAANAAIADTHYQNIGVADGRQYGINLDRPAFIHPSSEPIRASMDKQKQLKAEIRELVHLALSNVEPKMASAESKEADQSGLEAGLSYIGLELETLERRIAQIWMLYEGAKQEVTIAYPKRYSLKSDEEKRKEAEELKKLMHDTPSLTYKKEIIKRIATVTLGDKITADKLSIIFKEIESATILDTDPDVIQKDVEVGLVDLETASLARGYPSGVVEIAKKDHAERLARINAAQANMGTRDNPDETSSQDTHNDKEASKDTTRDAQVKDKTRGENDNISN